MKNRFKTFLLVLCLLIVVFGLRAQNYIKYHKKCVEASKNYLDGKFDLSIATFEELERKYSFFPHDEYTHALALVANGELEEARRRFLNAASKGGFNRWLDKDRNFLLQKTDSVWFASLKQEFITAETYFYQRDSMFFAVEWSAIFVLNEEYQDAIRSPQLVDFEPIYSGCDELTAAQRRVRTVIDLHEMVFLKIIDSPAPAGTKSVGLLGSFNLFLIHTPSHVLLDNKRKIRKWLKDGSLFPRDYAEAVDLDALVNFRPTRYGMVPNSSIPPKVGHLKRRKKVGVGSQEVERLRMHWSN